MIRVLPNFVGLKNWMLVILLVVSALALPGCRVLGGRRARENSLVGVPCRTDACVAEPAGIWERVLASDCELAECHCVACGPDAPFAARSPSPWKSCFLSPGWLRARLRRQQTGNEFQAPHSRFHPVPTRPVFASMPSMLQPVDVPLSEIAAP